MVTRTVGRTTKIVEIAKIVRDRQLTTLPGSGGSGKTRLSVEVAAELALEFADGVRFCSLAQLRDPDAVASVLSDAVSVPPRLSQSVEDAVIDYLRAKHLLVVIDNCEHLVDAVAELVQTIIGQCPRASILATSRQPLGLVGERMVSVPSLGMPPPDQAVDQMLEFDAIRLFCERAADVDAGDMTSDTDPWASRLGAIGARTVPYSHYCR